MLTLRRGHSYVFHVESLWSDENGTAIVILPDGGIAFAPFNEPSDTLVRQALALLGFQVTAFTPVTPDIRGQRKYACAATWNLPDAAIEDKYPCDVSGSTSSYHNVTNWPSGIALTDMQDVTRPAYRGAPMVMPRR
jgi:hypothetical protein